MRSISLSLLLLALGCPQTEEDPAKANSNDAEVQAIEDSDRDGFTDETGDCDDNDNDVFPGALELCNGVDDDCDGTVDEDVTLALVRRRG